MTIPAEWIPMIVVAVVFFVIFLSSLALSSMVLRRREKKAKLIQRVHQGKNMPESEEHAPSSSLMPEKEGNIGNQLLHVIGLFGKRIVSDESLSYSQLRDRLLKAGLHRPSTPAVFWGARFFLAFSVALLFFLFRVTVFKILGTLETISILVFLSYCGFYLPNIWLHIRTRTRKNKIIEGLPDALDLLVICVEAGMGLDAAISRVAEEMALSNKPLSEELKLYNLDIMAGKLRQDALRNLAWRTDVDDVNSLVTLLIQTDRFGTSVAKALRIYSDTFRSKRQLRAEEIAAGLPVRLTFPLIIFFLVPLVLLILGPLGIRFFQVVMN